MMKHTPQTEEYLESMARFKENKKEPTISALAEELGVSKASVSEMIKKLEEKELVIHGRYGTPELTKKGMERGMALLRKHRLLHRFLEMIGVKKSKVHEEACLMEHVLSDDVERKITAMVSEQTTLATLKKGQHAEIIAITAGQKCLQRLTDMGLTKGTTVRIVKTAPFCGPITIRVRETSLAIGNGIAGKIIVRVK